MAGLPFTLTTAGLALANPANTGTNAIVIDRIGVSAVAIPGDPDDNLGLLQLPNELKRLATFAGVVAGDDVIHVTVRDESPDVYQLRTFGLYSAQGVLLAFYSQATPIMEKASASMLLLAADLQFTTPIAAELVFGDTNFINPPATTAMPGVVELATSAETQAGTDAQRAVTPLGLKATLQTWAANFAAAVHGHAIADIAGLAAALAGKSPTGHKHDAADVETGTFNVARIPTLAMAKISGLVEALAGKAAAAHSHDAGDTVTGTFAVARIPSLAMSKITGLVDALAGKAATDHQHDAENVTAGVFNILRIPDLAIAKITGLADALASKADLAGANFVGNLSILRGNAYTWFQISANPGQVKELILATLSKTRWAVRSNSSAENGDSSGSNFEIRRYDDNGDFLSIAMTINRQNGATSFEARPSWGGATPWDSANFDPSPLAFFVPRAGAWTRHQTPHGWLDIGPANAEFCHFYTDRPSFYLNKPLLILGLEVWHAGNFNPGDKAASNHTHAASTYAAPGLIEMATNAEASAGTDQERAINPYVLQIQLNAAVAGIPTANSSARGLIEVATNAEALAGADALRAICPASLAYVLDNRAGGAISETALAMYWPAGELHLFAKASPPAGARLLVAEGQAVSRTTYARLFAEIGTTFGAGNGASTFNLPDWRGVFFRGLDRARGLDPNRQLGVYQASQNLRHNHTIPSRSNPDAGAANVEDAGGGGSAYSPWTGYEGGDEARPVNEALLACISY